MTYKVWKPELTNVYASAQIGDGTTIGAFSEIGDGVIIGKNCKIQNGVFIPKGVTIGDNVFLGPRVCFTNDRYPSAKEYGKFEETVVEDGASIGACAVIRCGIRIGANSLIGAGSVVTHDVPPGVTIKGNPAK